MTYYIHQTPGRLRVSTPALKGRPEAAVAVHASLHGICGVRAVRSNPKTGSVIVHYDAHALSPGVLINRLASAGFLTGVIGFPGLLKGRGQDASQARSRYSSAPASTVRAAKKDPVSSLSPHAKRLFVRITTQLILPFVAERAFGKVGRVVVSALL